MSFARVGEVTLYYEVHGAGDPVLLIAGTGSSHHAWMVETVPRLQDRFRLIVYDQRGTGRSDKPDIDYSTRMFAQDAAGLLDAIGVAEPVHVVGWSMGGRVAQWLALDFPEKVRSLVLAATGPGSYDDFQPIRGIPLRHALELTELGYEGYRRHYATSEFMFPKEFAESHPEVMRRVLKRVENDDTPLVCYLRHIIARQQHETFHLLGGIRAPTLVIDGAEDRVVRGTGNHVRSSQVLAERIPNARLVLIPGCAHGFFYQEPGLTHELMADFFRSH